MAKKSLDLVGIKFGMLEVKARSEYKCGRDYKWKCLCDCGNTTYVIYSNLKTSNTISCGCHRRFVLTKHGMWNTLVYGVWATMVQRCTNPKDKKWKDYGGRSITVCPEWLDFSTFYADMGDPPEERLSIERRNNNQGYSKDNCYWATAKEQGRNKRNNHLVTINGVTKCLVEWTEESNIPSKTVYTRINKLGWTPQDALTIPVRNRKS